MEGIDNPKKKDANPMQIMGSLGESMKPALKFMAFFVHQWFDLVSEWFWLTFASLLNSKAQIQKHVPG